ncbi:MAG: bifunctional acetate--CoA ligase family protein/GNAT family N-acetyltransferase [Pseudoxanthomonas sp.]
MSTYRLKSVFQPQSVAIVGGSPRERSAGRAVARNLRLSGFAGKLGWVSPHYNEIDGIATVGRIGDLPWTPDLVVVTTPAPIVPKVVAEAAAHGAGAAVVLTAINDAALAARTEAAARRHGMRLLGPHCLGVISPHFRLNASIAARTPPPGDLALVSQSSAIAAALVEWSASREVGFSAVVSLGDAVDVDFADLLDHFATDHRTRAILLYVERIRDARKFMSAARAAARAKPVVVVKSGQRGPAPGFEEVGMRALAPQDAVYAAAFRRAGLLQVDTLDELFAAAETLGRLRTFPGRRLAILGNGGGVGALALDQLRRLGGTAAELSADTVDRLDRLLPDGWSRENPIDIVVDADGERYANAIESLLADDRNDALMVINVPTAFTSSAEAAQGLAGALAKKAKNKPVFAVWLGQDQRTQATLKAAHVPSYASESDAIHGFMHLVRYREAQNALMETPPSLPQGFAPDVEAARAIVRDALAKGGGQLDAEATLRLLAAYDIPVAPLRFAADAEAAVRAAEPLLAAGKTVALKVHSRDIAHKASVNGVRLDLNSAQAVREAAIEVLRNARDKRPEARIDGVVVQAMEQRPEARELIAAIADDPLFGPVIVFGRGGTAVRVVDDLALALPPLDLRLAHELIGRTRISRRLQAYRGMSAVDQRGIALVLVKLAQLAADLPEIKQLSLNPLLADPDGLVAVDARAIVEAMPPLHKGRGHPRFAIFPYPQEWERRIELADGAPAFVRPVRPEDDALFREFFTHVSDEDLRLRFFQSVKHFSHEFIARLTQMDYARSIALVMLDADGNMLGAVRLMADANYEKGEYGILVRSDLKGHGIGWRLMTIMIEYAGWLGLREVDGQVLRENRSMLDMCRQLGFDIKPDPDDPGLMDVRLPVAKPA